MNQKDPSRFLEPARTTQKEIEFRVELEKYFKKSIGSNVKMENVSI